MEGNEFCADCNSPSKLRQALKITYGIEGTKSVVLGMGDTSDQTQCMLAVECSVAYRFTWIPRYVVCRSGVGFGELRLRAVHRVLRSTQEAGLSHFQGQVTQSGRVEVGSYRNQISELTHFRSSTGHMHVSILEAILECERYQLTCTG